jgi:hypothetical protein
MTPLEIPLNFVFAARNLWPEIEGDAVETVDEALIARRATSSSDVWISSSYVIFRQHGYPVTWSRRPRPGAVNAVAVRDFGRKARAPRPFVLCLRADAHRMRLANFVLNQNGLEPPGPGHDWVPHWPQPALRPRDPARGDRIETLVFKGEEHNLDAALRSPGFRDALAAEGLAFDIGGRDATGGVDWTDYRAADLVLAARNLTVADARSKPASKLVNAWRAGVPALLGPEPAYRELRRSDLDFIEVTGPEDVLAAVRRLRQQPGLYRAMVEHGLARGSDWGVEAVLARWVEVLNGPVQVAFRAWEAAPAWRRRLRWAMAIAGEDRARRRHRAAAGRGPRIFEAYGQQ